MDKRFPITSNDSRDSNTIVKNLPVRPVKELQHPQQPSDHNSSITIQAPAIQGKKKAGRPSKADKLEKTLKVIDERVKNLLGASKKDIKEYMKNRVDELIAENES